MMNIWVAAEDAPPSRPGRSGLVSVQKSPFATSLFPVAKFVTKTDFQARKRQNRNLDRKKENTDSAIGEKFLEAREDFFGKIEQERV